MNREIKFRAWDKQAHDWNKANGEKPFPLNEMIGWEELRDYGMDALDGEGQLVIMQFTGLKDPRNKRDIYEGDIYFEEVETDEGDMHLYLVCTWIKERAAFAWLSKGEYTNYIDNGFDAIERDFDGMYFELNQSDIEKLHYAGNIFQNPDLIENGGPQ